MGVEGGPHGRLSRVPACGRQRVTLGCVSTEGSTVRPLMPPLVMADGWPDGAHHTCLRCGISPCSISDALFGELGLRPEGK